MAPRRKAAAAAAVAAAAGSVVDLTEDANEGEGGSTPTSANSKKRKVGASLNEDNNNGKKKAAKKEKRAARYRSSCPQGLRDRFTRALGQRMYLISKEEVEYDNSNDKDNSGLSTCWKFAMLGSTGNIYNVTLGHKPSCNCPDHLKRGDLCKHMMFVLCRVIGLEPHNPLAYQKAYLTSELEELFERMKQRTMANVWANERVQSQYVAIQQGKSTSQDEDDDDDDDNDNNSGKVKRRPLDEQDCPICLESMSTCPKDQVTFCKTACGMNFHLDCMRQWRRAQTNGKLTCPNCR